MCVEDRQTGGVPPCPKGIHRLAPQNIRTDTKGRQRCRLCYNDENRSFRRRRNNESLQWHVEADHQVVRGQTGRLRCRTCETGADDVDEVVVWRIVTGDHPGGESAAERDAAIFELWSLGVGNHRIGVLTGRSGREVLVRLERMCVDPPVPYWRETVFWRAAQDRVSMCV